MNMTNASDEVMVPFNADLFANREEERKLFFNTVRAKTKQMYLEFTGVAGQGKSEFLKWIYHNAKEQQYFSAYIDFEFAEYHTKELYPILKAIAEQLSSQSASESFRSFQKALSLYLEELRDIYRKALIDDQPADRKLLLTLEKAFTNAFNDSLSSILETHKVVFCLDSTEKAYAHAFQSFEKHVINRYTKHPNFILITAGQEEVVWKSLEIRNLVRQHELPCLNTDGISKQVKTLARKKGFGVLDNDMVLKTMLELTQGHPFSAYKLIDFWTQGFQSTLNKTVVEQQLSQSIRELSQKVINERILKKFELSEDYPLVTDILWYLAPLRHIEFDTFKFILSTFFQEWFTGKRYIFFQKLMAEFHNSYIFKRWHLGSGFDMDPVVRNILLWDMRINAPTTFRKVEETLAKQYDSWIDRTHDATQIRNIIERLYHYAMYLKETQQSHVELLVQKELKRYLDTYFYSDVPEDTKPLYNQLNRLYNTLEEDEELHTVVNVSILLNMLKERL